MPALQAKRMSPRRPAALVSLAWEYALNHWARIRPTATPKVFNIDHFLLSFHSGTNCQATEHSCSDRRHLFRYHFRWFQTARHTRVEKAQIELAVEPLRETIWHGGGTHRHRLRCGNDLHRYFRCFCYDHGMGVGGHAAKVTQEALPNESGTRGQLRRPRFSAS